MQVTGSVPPEITQHTSERDDFVLGAEPVPRYRIANDSGFEVSDIGGELWVQASAIAPQISKQTRKPTSRNELLARSRLYRRSLTPLTLSLAS